MGGERGHRGATVHKEDGEGRTKSKQNLIGMQKQNTFFPCLDSSLLTNNGILEQDENDSTMGEREKAIKVLTSGAHICEGIYVNIKGVAIL